MADLKSKLKDAPLFDGAAARDIDRLATESREVTLDAGTSIFRRGDACSALGIVLGGELRVYRTALSGRAITLYRVEPGESCILSTHCVLGGGPFPAIAEVSQKATALLIPADTFRSWFESSTFWRKYVFRLMSHRIATLMELIDQVAFRRIDERLALFLIERSAAGEPVIEATHEQIASEIGSSREVVSRIASELACDGLLRIGRGRVEILDRPRLVGLIAAPSAITRKV